MVPPACERWRGYIDFFWISLLEFVEHLYFSFRDETLGAMKIFEASNFERCSFILRAGNDKDGDTILHRSSFESSIVSQVLRAHLSRVVATFLNVARTFRTHFSINLSRNIDRKNRPNSLRQKQKDLSTSRFVDSLVPKLTTIFATLTRANFPVGQIRPCDEFFGDTAGDIKRLLKIFVALCPHDT